MTQKPAQPQGGSVDQPQGKGGSADVARITPVAPVKPAAVKDAPAKPAQKPEPKSISAQLPPMASPARVRPRHRLALASFVLMVLLPVVVASAYLWTRAADQYVSHVAFSVRQANTASPTEALLGGLEGLGGLGSLTGGGADTDILYEFIQSQELVARVDARLNLREIYARPEGDPVFTFDATGTIEDLTDYWGRMVKVFYDSGTGLIELRVHAFTAEEAQRIAEVTFEESSSMINELSAIARDDSTRYAREDLEHAIERLKQARQAITAFRSENQLVDPEVTLGAQTGLLTALEQQLSDALITYDLLLENSSNDNPRIEQAETRIDVIRRRLAEERQKFGSGGGELTEDFAALVGDYQSLAVDLEFAEQTYLAALTNFDAAQAEAQRQSRYLAAHIRPTLAERPQYPQRLLIAALTTAFLIFIWATTMLIAYSIKDRR